MKQKQLKEEDWLNLENNFDAKYRLIVSTSDVAKNLSDFEQEMRDNENFAGIKSLIYLKEGMVFTLLSETVFAGFRGEKQEQNDRVCEIIQTTEEFLKFNTLYKKYDKYNSAKEYSDLDLFIIKCKDVTLHNELANLKKEHKNSNKNRL